MVAGAFSGQAAGAFSGQAVVACSSRYKCRTWWLTVVEMLLWRRWARIKDGAEVEHYCVSFLFLLRRGSCWWWRCNCDYCRSNGYIVASRFFSNVAGSIRCESHLLLLFKGGVAMLVCCRCVKRIWRCYSRTVAAWKRAIVVVANLQIQWMRWLKFAGMVVVTVCGGYGEVQVR